MKFPLINIPLLLDGVYAKDIEVEFLFQKNIFNLDLKTLIGSIMVFLSLIPLIFLLYTIIKMGRLEIKLNHPRVIIGSSIFIVLFIAGLIIIFL